ARARAEHPALAAHQRLDHGDRDHVLQRFELAEDEGAVCPRAGEGDIEVIAPRLGGEAAPAGRTGAAVGRDPAAEARRRADETARADLVALVLPDAVDEHAHGILLVARLRNQHGAKRNARTAAPDCATRSIRATEPSFRSK